MKQCEWCKNNRSVSLASSIFLGQLYVSIKYAHMDIVCYIAFVRI